MSKFTISGYSTALFSTWYFVEELGVLFDAGDGLSAGLLQKSRKIKHVFISHPDRDHLMGLFQFNQLNARADGPIIYYPRDSGSFPQMASFAAQFDPHVIGAQWQPVAEGDTVWINERIGVEVVRNEHIAVPPGVSKSLSFKLFEQRQKLHPDLTALSADQVRQVVAEKGKAETTVTQRHQLIAYSGDTPISDASRWQDCNVLIHEATFLGEGFDKEISNHRNKHSTLAEVMEMVRQTHVRQLILGHFSSRYSAAMIDDAIRHLRSKYQVEIPIFRVLPGQVAQDILRNPALIPAQ